MKEKNKKYYIFTRDYIAEQSFGSILIKSGTPFYLIEEHTCSNEYMTLSKIEKLENVFDYGVLYNNYSGDKKDSPIEISKETAIEIANEIDYKYKKNKEWNENRKRRIARFLLNLFLFPFNIFYKIDCGKEISDYIMWQ